MLPRSSGRAARMRVAPASGGTIVRTVLADEDVGPDDGGVPQVGQLGESGVAPVGPERRLVRERHDVDLLEEPGAGIGPQDQRPFDAAAVRAHDGGRVPLERPELLERVLADRQDRDEGHAPRRRGSSVSRSASPNRLDPNTARLIARPGYSTRCGAFCAYSAAETESMRPHDGYGSGTPRPRKDRAASTRMAAPSWAVHSTMKGPTVLGRTCRKAMRRWRSPSARAASMYCISRIDSTLARMMRAARGTIGMEMAMITFGIEGPSEADITSASTSSGSPCRMSSSRWATRSVLPPA